MTLGRIDVYGLSMPSCTSVDGPGGPAAQAGTSDDFAILDLSNSVHLHQSSLRIEDDTKLDGEAQANVYCIVRAFGKDPIASRASRSLVDEVVRHFLSLIPWQQFAGGDLDRVASALQDALSAIRVEIARRMDQAVGAVPISLTLAFVRWPDLYVANSRAGRVYLKNGGSKARTRVIAEHPLRRMAAWSARA